MTLDADTESVVRRFMEQRGISFKQALNDAIRAGAEGTAPRRSFATDVRHRGVPVVKLDNALQLAGELEDEDRVRQLRTGQ